MWPALILAALGTKVVSDEAKQASRRGRNEGRRGRETQERIQGKRRESVMGEAESYRPEARQEALDTKASETQAKIEALLSDAAATAPVGTSGGKVSEKVLGKRAQTTRDRANEASVLAALLSKIRAPGDVAGDEAVKFLGTTGDVRRREHESRRAGDYTNQRVRLLSTPDADTMALGGLMQQGGLSLASGQILGQLGKGAAAGSGGFSMPGNVYPSADSQVYSNFLQGIR